MDEHSADVTIDVAAPAALREDQEFWRLYEVSFDQSVREAPAIILRSLDLGTGFVLRARVSGRTVGLATGQILTGPASTFLVYLAVDPVWRSRQIGRALFEAADRAGTAQLDGRRLTASGVVWEIDDPEADVDEAERKIRRRRTAFFQNLGGQLLDAPYLQPPLDGRTVVPMRVMFRPASGTGLPGAADVSALIRAIYFEKYNAVNEIPAPVLERLAARVEADKLPRWQ